MKKTLQILLMTCTAVSAPVLAASVPNMVRLTIESGQASGVVDGPIAEQARLKLNATGSLTLSVKRLFLYQQAGCARVQLDFHQADALPPGTVMPTPYSWATQMNICSDGQPPLSLKRRSK